MDWKPKMKTTKDFLNDVKAKTGADTDYALAKVLDTSKQVIHGYQHKNLIMSDEIALKVASILELEPVLVFASIHSEKSKNEATKAAWKTVFERLGGVAATVMVASTLLTNPAISSTCKGVASCQCILCKMKRRKKIPNPLEFLVAQIIQA